MKELRKWKLNMESCKKNQRESSMEIRPKSPNKCIWRIPKKKNKMVEQN